MNGILMKPSMNEAIRREVNPKTVTRRIMKPQPPDEYERLLVGHYNPTKVNKDGEQYPGEEVYGAYTDDGEWGQMFRYHPGQVVYVKETHYRYGWWDKDGLTPAGKQKYRFVADSGMEPIFPSDLTEPLLTVDGKEDEGFFLRSPLFLEAKYARTFLEIISVRPERLMEITEEDAIREGAPGIATSKPYPRQYRDSYEALWDSINPDMPFSSNPWVWRIEFKKVAKPEVLK
jgi:hypothetical protein